MTKSEIERTSNAKLDSGVIRIDRRANYKGFPLRTVDQFGEAVAKRHIIKGVFARGETSALIEPPRGLKSALMAEAAVAAAGMDWQGRRNKQQCGLPVKSIDNELAVIGTAPRGGFISPETALDWARDVVPGCVSSIPDAITAEGAIV